MDIEVTTVDAPPEGAVVDRNLLAGVKTVKGEVNPHRVISKVTKNQLAAFAHKEHAIGFIENVAYEVLLR
jgi:hypothetical protein